ncbi:MAG: sulfatase-like hydrolase/transferase [Verrucomicrobiales bacterium]
MKAYLFHLLLATLALAINSHAQVGAVTPPASLEELTPIPGAKPRNALFILIDDLRYDALSCLGHPFIKTPNIDRIAKNGAIFQNAFVTTSLCSPSRASILTGLYMHHHGVVDNNAQSPGLVFFPQYLQKAGYETAFFGKWHMGGESDDPRPGFNRWVSFKGQGNYLPPNPNYTLNVDGERVKQKGYITDELTDYAMDWLQARDRSKPWFAYVSHKAVHAEFHPAERHKDLYSDAVIAPPATQSEESNRTKPLWVRNQRNSWHGVDFPYHSSLDVAEYYRQYCRTLAAVDESVGRLLDWLEKSGQADNTLVMFMGDNGFLFGEFGLIDKRNAYEPSMRVPLLGQCPGVIPAGS